MRPIDGYAEKAAMPDRARERRKLAAECLSTACQTPNASLRAILVGIAQRWLDQEYNPADPDYGDRAVHQQVIRTRLGRARQVEFKLDREIPEPMSALLMELDVQRPEMLSLSSAWAKARESHAILR